MNFKFQMIKNKFFPRRFCCDEAVIISGFLPSSHLTCHFGRHQTSHWESRCPSLVCVSATCQSFGDFTWAVSRPSCLQRPRNLSLDYFLIWGQSLKLHESHCIFVQWRSSEICIFSDFLESLVETQVPGQINNRCSNVFFDSCSIISIVRYPFFSPWALQLCYSVACVFKTECDVIRQCSCVVQWEVQELLLLYWRLDCFTFI